MIFIKNKTRLSLKCYVIDVPSWEPIYWHEVIHEWVSLGL